MMNRKSRAILTVAVALGLLFIAAGVRIDAPLVAKLAASIVSLVVAFTMSFFLVNIMYRD